MKGHMQDGKFHPHTPYLKGVRKSRDQNAKQTGIKIDSRMKREKHDEQMMAPQIKGMSEAKRKEWEDVVNSEVVKVKKEMINGKPVTSVRFANGEEWFEFDDVKHQEDYMKKEKIEVDESVVGEFVEIEHPDIAGYITMATGKVLFGEREDRRKREKKTFVLVGHGEEPQTDLVNQIGEVQASSLEEALVLARKTAIKEGFDNTKFEVAELDDLDNYEDLKPEDKLKDLQADAKREKEREEK